VTNYSDHKKPQINIKDYLPEVYRSDVNNTLSEMAFDRQFTKDDTIRVSGFVGTGNPNAVVDRQIPEVSNNSHDQAHRQAFQLAPTMYTKIGTIETALSYHNFLTQLELQGVDIDRLPIWGSALEFNWVPPINIDMLVNYQNYFWNGMSSTDAPQYFTIENVCNKASDKVASYETLMQQRGIHLPVISIDFVNNTFVLQGKQDNIFSTDFTFYTNLSNTTQLTDKYWRTVSVTYDISSNKTKVKVAEVIAPTIQPINPSIGDWWYNTTTNNLQEWNGTTWIEYTDTIVAQIIIPALFTILSSSFADNTLSIEGKQDDLFVSGFVFLTKDSSTINMQNKYWTTSLATYDDVTNTTIIQTVTPLAYNGETAPTPTFIGEWWYQPSSKILYTWDGSTWIATNKSFIANISLSELLLIFQTQVNCKCHNDIGWDIGLWDDNSIGNVAWNTTLLTKISFSTEADWIAYNSADPTMMVGGQPLPLTLWYDTSTNQLKQYGDLLHPIPSDPLFVPSWNVVASNFSAVLTLTTATENWDENIDCVSQVLNQWSNQNRWQHKTAINTYANVKRAQVPILEYDSNLELNEWSKVQRTWKYRKTSTDVFEVSTISPSRIELEPIKGYQVEGVSGAWYIYLFDKTSTMNANINLTDVFIPEYKFSIVNDIGFHDVYTVDWSEYREMDTSTNPALQGNYFVTVVRIKETTFMAPSVGGLNQARIIPTKTSRGDNWYGYHVHWVLDITNITTTATNPQSLNFFQVNDAVTNTLPGVDQISFGYTFQELTVGQTPPTTIDLVPSLQYNSSNANPYATPNSNELRVYVNGIRQYGTYIENISTGFPSYTAVGNITTFTGRIPFVVGITFTSLAILKSGDLIRIEVSPASVRDMGMYAVPVRTIEDDATFSALVNSSQQPIYQSLTEFVLAEQHKIEINQYPLFNVYDLMSGNVMFASPIITFKESQDAPINSAVQRRIVVTNNGIDFEFDQHLLAPHSLDTDDNYLYGYRNLLLPVVGQYWYSQLTSKVLYWDGYTWSDSVLLPTVNGTTLRTIIVQSTDPIELWTMDQALWFNTTTNTLYRRNVATTSWIVIPGVIINDADPTLRTIWRRGTNNEQYVPQYVDKKRNVVPVGSANGDWEVVKQWIYNPEHRNRPSVSLSQLVTHFRGIIDNQAPTLGLISGGVYTKVQSEYNYGVGGTIKEFNGAFDTLISAINVTNTTPVGVIEYASNDYAANIRFVRDIFNRAVIDLCGQYVVEGVETFSQHITNSVIALYEDNDYVAKLYGDTTAYDEVTGNGVRNWIATAPMFGLAPYYQPHLLDDGTFTQVYHHDGHRTDIVYSLAEEDAIARKIISLADPRISGQTLGASGLTAPPATESAFLTQYGGSEIRSGVFWYKTGSPRTFYRFEMYMASAVHPSFYYNGVEILDGIYYYNIITHAVYRKSGLNWIGVTTPGAGDIQLLWQEIDFQTLLGEVYLELENRLYEMCIGVVPVYDYSTLTPTSSEQLVYDQKYRKRFDEYVINHSVPVPFVNTQYRQTDAFTWNYITSTILTPPHSYTAPSPSACWQALYTSWYGTPYPHLEPWKLQGFDGKPTWWDTEYKQTNGTRTWIFNYAPSGSSLGTGMWENIRTGQVPAGRTYPDGRVSTGNSGTDGQSLRTYIYFSVNITNSTITGGYTPDQLLPPYYVTSDAHVRSFFTNMNQIKVPDADYIFGDGNIIEWQWNISPQYPYENPIIAFLMQPVKFLRASFGPRYTYVDGLEVDTTFGQVYSHSDVLFHGDMYGVNGVYVAKGLNQWYVNFNRFAGYDTNVEFRDLWAGWTPLLTYQFNSIVDTSTLDIANKKFDIINTDYNVVLINNGSFRELWIDAFNISVVGIPPSIIQYNNQNKWKLELTSLASVARDMYYYDVKAYPFIVDPVTDECYAYRYLINGIDSVANRFYVAGNETDVFVYNTTITVTGSSSINGNFTVVSSVYESSVDRTRINVLEQLVGTVGNGVITIAAFVFPWSTGDMVVLSSDKVLPAPLVPNTPYYVINTGNQSFKLSESFNDSITNISIDIVSMGVSIHTIAEIASSFNVFGGESHSKETWYHYALDKSKVLILTSPQVITGMQTLINTIDGYAEYQQDSGVIFNTADSGDFDFNTGRLINWSLELERFIDWAYGLRKARMVVNDRFEYTVNITDNTLTVVDTIPYWNDGTAIQVSTTGSLPSPLDANETYFVVKTATDGVIKLSASKDITYTAFHIDLLTQGSGHFYLAVKDMLRSYPSFEINPSRNNIWLDTPLGVLSNVISGPYTDIRVRQTIFDQYGRALSADKLIVHRQDERNRITILPQLPNDVDPFYVGDPYNYIHLGGGHFFLEGYEHFLLFNPYTAGNVLVYDSFLGLYASKFEMNFFKKAENTLRPTLGGFYLRGNAFNRNIEGSATDLQNFYDTYAGSEDSPNIKLARSLLGYTGKVPYMEMLNVNSKSQFLFYRGMLHAKGSVSSIVAYINSRRFIDAKIDEFWAVKIAEFGDNRPRIYPEILLFTNDAIVDDIRFEFVGLEDDITRADITYAVTSKGFKLVSFADDSRWNNFPEQRAEIIQPLFLDSDISSLSRVFIAPIPPSPISSSDFEYWYNTTDNTLRSWNTVDWTTLINNKIHITSNYVYWHHDEPCDDIRIIRRNANISSKMISIIHSFSSTAIIDSTNTFSVAEDMTTRLYPGTTVTISQTVHNNGTYIVDGTVFDELRNITYISVTTPIPYDEDNGKLTYFDVDYSLYSTNLLIDQYTGTRQYVKLNSEVTRIDQSAFFDIIHIYTVRPSIDKLNPAKLVDRKTGIIIDRIALWHPAFGIHSYKALYNINLKSDKDPATYSVTMNSADIPGHFWDFAEVGTIWLDTSQLGYIPYYDESVYPDINDRLYKWGNIAEYANIKVYQWVRSNVVPSEWDAIALQQQGNITIPQNQKITGTARKLLFKRTRNISDGTIRFGNPTIVTVPAGSYITGQIVYFTATSALPTELQNQTQYVVDAATRDNPQTFSIASVNNNGLITDIAGPVILATIINIGNNKNPIQVFKVDSGVLSLGDIITISTIPNGLFPQGSTTIPVASYGYQEVIYTTEKVDSSSTGLANDTTAYTATFDIDNVTRSLSVVGDTTQTFSALMLKINTALGIYATATLVNGNIRITSASGSTSQVTITDGNLFRTMTDFNFINVIGASNTEYSLRNINNTDIQTFEINTFNDTPITIQNGEVGQLTLNNVVKPITIVPIFTSDNWIQQLSAKQRIIGAWLSTDTEPLLYWKATVGGDIWYPNDTVNVYLNGKLYTTGTVVYNATLDRFEVSTVGSNMVVQLYDYIDVIRPIHSLTSTESNFDPSLSDDGTTDVHWKEDYEYSQSVTSVGVSGTSTLNYYFWVEKSTTKNTDPSSMSTSEITNYMSTMPDPYFIVQKPLDSDIVQSTYGYAQQDYGIIWDVREPINPIVSSPVIYREAIIRNVANYINDNNRYMIQFTRDLALRDHSNTIMGELDLKDKHEEWLMFREKQSNNISQFLWNKAIEALTGVSLTDGTPVPSLDRVLYDDNYYDKYGTETRYGLELGQAFVNKTLGLKTLLTYLLDPTRDFAPIDINNFFFRNTFTTPAGIQAAMIEIYDTFGAEHVNGIWFELLQDALSTKSKYKGLMKTSWVALHGIRILEVNGMFDD